MGVGGLELGLGMVLVKFKEWSKPIKNNLISKQMHWLQKKDNWGIKIGYSRTRQIDKYETPSDVKHNSESRWLWFVIK